MSQSINSKVCPCPNEHQSQNMSCNVLNTAVPNQQSKVPSLHDQIQQASQHASKMSHLSANINANNAIFETQPNQGTLGGQSKNLDALSKRITLLESDVQGLMSKGTNGLQG